MRRASQSARRFLIFPKPHENVHYIPECNLAQYEDRANTFKYFCQLYTNVCIWWLFICCPPAGRWIIQESTHLAKKRVSVTFSSSRLNSDVLQQSLIARDVSVILGCVLDIENMIVQGRKRVVRTLEQENSLKNMKIIKNCENFLKQFLKKFPHFDV
jgi:hypothetical protein